MVLAAPKEEGTLQCILPSGALFRRQSSGPQKEQNERFLLTQEVLNLNYMKLKRWIRENVPLMDDEAKVLMSRGAMLRLLDAHRVIELSPSEQAQLLNEELQREEGEHQLTPNSMATTLLSNSDPVGEYLPGFLHGSRKDSNAPGFWTDHKVTHVLSVCANPAEAPEGVVVEHIDIPDRFGADLLAELPRALRFIHSARSNGGVVFCHCSRGVSRSGALCIAYLMQACDVTYDDALAHARDRRPSIEPNISFVKQLKEFRTALDVMLPYHTSFWGADPNGDHQLIKQSNAKHVGTKAPDPQIACPDEIPHKHVKFKSDSLAAGWGEAVLAERTGGPHGVTLYDKPQLSPLCVDTQIPGLDSTVRCGTCGQYGH